MSLLSIPINCTKLFPTPQKYMNIELYRFFNRSRENLSRGRDFGRDSLGLRDGSEMVVSDACVKGKLDVFLYV